MVQRHLFLRHWMFTGRRNLPRESHVTHDAEVGTDERFVPSTETKGRDVSLRDAEYHIFGLLSKRTITDILLYSTIY